MKRIFRKIHLWLSVPFGIVITLVCFSGAMLVFEKELTRLYDSEAKRTGVEPDIRFRKGLWYTPVSEYLK